MAKRPILLAVPLALLTGAMSPSAAGSVSIAGIAPYFIALDDIIVPIVDGNAINGRLSFKAVIAANDEAGRKRLKSIKPRLRSESLMAGLEFSRLHASGLRPVNAVALAEALTNSLKQSHPDIEKVLLVKSSANMG